MKQHILVAQDSSSGHWAGFALSQHSFWANPKILSDGDIADYCRFQKATFDVINKLHKQSYMAKA